MRTIFLVSITFAVAAVAFLLTRGDEHRPSIPRPGTFTTLAARELDRARTTGDPTAYDRATRATQRALQLAPGDPSALVQSAALLASRHDFAGALRAAEEAERAAPDLLAPLAPKVDALVELGRLPEATRTLQRLLDRKPDLAALARVSYLRELHGDVPGALRALRDAESAASGAGEGTAFVLAVAGDLELQRGHLAAARRAYGRALAARPGHPASELGLARLDAARGRTTAAIARLRRLVERLPLPEHVAALAELELAAGDRAASRRAATPRTAGDGTTRGTATPRADRLRDAARRDLALVATERRLLAGAGVDVDVEAAVFAADHGDPREAVRLARRAWAKAPSVRSADALGWALTRAGRPDEGLRWAQRALAEGWGDPGPVSHAGLAALAADRPDLARPLLRRAERGAAWLGPWQAERVRRALEGTVA